MRAVASATFSPSASGANAACRKSSRAQLTTRLRSGQHAAIGRSHPSGRRVDADGETRALARERASSDRSASPTASAARYRARRWQRDEAATKPEWQCQSSRVGPALAADATRAVRTASGMAWRANGKVISRRTPMRTGSRACWPNTDGCLPEPPWSLTVGSRTGEAVNHTTGRSFGPTPTSLGLMCPSADHEGTKQRRVVPDQPASPATVQVRRQRESRRARRHLRPSRVHSSGTAPALLDSSASPARAIAMWRGRQTGKEKLSSTIGSLRLEAVQNWRNFSPVDTGHDRNLGQAPNDSVPGREAHRLNHGWARGVRTYGWQSIWERGVR